MPNFSKATMARIGRMLSTGDANDPAPLLKLAKSGALGRKAIYNWTLAETDPQHRRMPRVAKRMVATMAYFAAAGLLNDKRLEEIAALEAALETETEANATLRRMKRVLAGGKKPNAADETAPAAASADEADEHDDHDDLGDEDEGHTPEHAVSTSTPHAA